MRRTGNGRERRKPFVPEERYYAYRGFLLHFWNDRDGDWYAEKYDELCDLCLDGNQNGLKLDVLLRDEVCRADYIRDEWAREDFADEGAAMKPTPFWERLPPRFRTLEKGSPAHYLTPALVHDIRNNKLYGQTSAPCLP